MLHNDWESVLKDQFHQPYFHRLMEFIHEEYSEKEIFPPKDDLFKALELTSYQDTKVVILGQDPYHGVGQAHGLSFSVKPGVNLPPSLKNIFKELADDVGCDIPNNGYLVPWAKQGVLLLNTVLTVQKGEAASHKGVGWERFTDSVIERLNDRQEPVIFVLWGKHAEKKKELITNTHHSVIVASHPSPFSARRGFFGSQPFSTINTLLIDRGQQPINWQILNL